MNTYTVTYNSGSWEEVPADEFILYTSGGGEYFKLYLDSEMVAAFVAHEVSSVVKSSGYTRPTDKTDKDDDDLIGFTPPEWDEEDDDEIQWELPLEGPEFD